MHFSYLYPVACGKPRHRALFGDRRLLLHICNWLWVTSYARYFPMNKMITYAFHQELFCMDCNPAACGKPRHHALFGNRRLLLHICSWLWVTSYARYFLMKKI